MGKILINWKIVAFLAVFTSISKGQSIELTPNAFTTNDINFNNVESPNEQVLGLKRTSNGIYTAIAFRNFTNNYLGGFYMGSATSMIESIAPISIKVGNPRINAMYMNTYFVKSFLPFYTESTIQSNELDFEETISTERRPVFADKDGILRVENSSNHYMSYNFTSVQAQNYDDQIIRGSGFAWFNTTTSPKTLYLPLNLPDGVKVTNVRMYLLDNSASNLSFTFSKNTHVTNTFTTIATTQSSTKTAGIFSINNNASETIDNANNSYYVNISSSGNWTGNTLQFHSLVITYQYQ